MVIVAERNWRCRAARRPGRIGRDTVVQAERAAERTWRNPDAQRALVTAFLRRGRTPGKLHRPLRIGGFDRGDVLGSGIHVFHLHRQLRHDAAARNAKRRQAQTHLHRAHFALDCVRCRLQVQRNRSRLCRRRAGHCASGQREEYTQQRPGSFHARRAVGGWPIMPPVEAACQHAEGHAAICSDGCRSGPNDTAVQRWGGAVAVPAGAVHRGDGSACRLGEIGQ